MVSFVFVVNFRKLETCAKQVVALIESRSREARTLTYQKVLLSRLWMVRSVRHGIVCRSFQYQKERTHTY